MGGLIGVLSTVILVSTVCTLIFAVGAYVISRKNRDGVGVMNETDVSDEAVADQFPQANPSPQPNIFKRVQPDEGTSGGEVDSSAADDEYQWK